jgi:hypothetical protein
MSEIKPESQPSPSGDADSIEEIKGLFAMLNLGHLRAMETPNTDVIIAADWLHSHDAKVGQAEQRLRSALEKLLSYNRDIRDGKINYRPEDHIQVAEAALQESPSDTRR